MKDRLIWAREVTFKLAPQSGLVLEVVNDRRLGVKSLTLPYNLGNEHGKDCNNQRQEAKKKRIDRT